MGQTNGLVGGEQGGEVATAGSQEFGCPGVGGLAKAKTSVLLGYFDPKGTDFGKFFEQEIWDFSGLVNFIRVGMQIECALQSL